MFCAQTIIFVPCVYFPNFIELLNGQVDSVGPGQAENKLLQIRGSQIQTYETASYRIISSSSPRTLSNLCNLLQSSTPTPCHLNIQISGNFPTKPTSLHYPPINPNPNPTITLEMLSDTLRDPFKALEQLPFVLEKAEQVALTPVKLDWKETQSSHIISIDVPGMNKNDIKIEVDYENWVLSISGERNPPAAAEGEKTVDVSYHRVERVFGKFWRQLKMPVNVDLESVKGKLDNGVLTLRLEKLSPEKVNKAARVVEIELGGESGTQKIKDGGAREEL